MHQSSYCSFVFCHDSHLPKTTTFETGSTAIKFPSTESPPFKLHLNMMYGNR